jgi:hypothetical protein
MTIKGRMEAMERSVREFEARLRKRVPPAFVVVNDPEAGLEEFRLPDDVVDKLGTIKIGRSDPNDPVEDGREWVARLTAEARCVTKPDA